MIKFDEQKHEYTDGKKVLISVTQLLSKHGLAPDYSGANSEILQASAEKGTLVHKEIEEYVNSGAVGFSEELETFIDICKAEKLVPVRAETVVNNDIVAGTYDLMALRNGVLCILDHKTTSTLHKKAVAWQLSIYVKLCGCKIDKIGAIHYPSKRLVWLDKIPDSEIEKLFDCERKGVIYHQDGEMLQLDSLLVQQAERAERAFVEAETAYEYAKAQKEQFRKAILEAMQRTGVKSFENDVLKITYKEAYERDTIDGARLKSEMPEVAREYTKKTKVGASVIVKVKDEIEN